MAGIGLILFVLFVVSGVYLTYLQEIHTKSKVISIGNLGMEDLLEKLRNELNCPFVKEFKLNEKGNIEFKCKYTIHSTKIENGNLYIDKLDRKFSGHREVEEAWYLQKYVERALDGNKVGNAEELNTQFLKYIKTFNVNRLIKYAFYVWIILFVLIKIGEMDETPKPNETVTEENTNIDSQETNEADTTEMNEEKDTENNYFGLNEAVAFNTKDGGIINITFTDYGSNGDDAYITYVIENIGETSVTVGESMFDVYANDYAVDLGWGEDTVYDTTISSGRKVSGHLYPNVNMRGVKKLEIECGGEVFLLRDTTKADAMLGTYYRIFEYDGHTAVSEVKLSRDGYGDNRLNIRAKFHEDLGYGDGSCYDYDYSSCSVEFYDDGIVFTSILYSVEGLIIYYSENPVEDGIYVEEVNAPASGSMFTGNYMWTDDIQAVYDSVYANDNSVDNNNTFTDSILGQWTRSDSGNPVEVYIYEWETGDSYIPIIYAYYYDGNTDPITYEGVADVVTDDKTEFVDDNGNRLVVRKQNGKLSIEQIGDFIPNGITFTADDYELMEFEYQY